MILQRKGVAADAVFHLRYLERYPLHTSFPDIVEDVALELARPPLSAAHATCELIIDASGLGSPVTDLFRRRGMRVTLRPVQITAGNAATCDKGLYRISKRLLVSNTQVVLQTGRLKVPRDLPGADVLVRELQNFQLTITEAANDVYEGRSGEHDDTVLATALALWFATNDSEFRMQPLGL